MEKNLYLVTFEAKNHSTLFWLEPVKCMRLVEAKSEWSAQEFIKKHNFDFIKFLDIKFMGNRNDILVA